MKPTAGLYDLQTPQEEFVNTITHGLGLLLSLVGTGFLLAICAEHGGWHLVACTIYGLTLMGMFGASTFYHGCRSVAVKQKARTIDHCAILTLIAGSYTPLMVLGLGGWQGYLTMLSVWGLAVFGIRHKFTSSNPFGVASVSLCLLMGWLVVLVWKPFVASVPPSVVGWLVSGGLVYTLGVPFYAWRGLPYNHGVWHLFVLGGAACHYFAVLQLLL